LCKEVLGKALAPESFPSSKIASLGSAIVTEETLQAKFAEHIDDKNIPVIIELLQNFQLCYREIGTNKFQFPTYISTSLDVKKWTKEAKFTR